MKTVAVPRERLDENVRYWARRGLRVTSSSRDWVILERPPRMRPDRSFWRALKLSMLTLGVYPLLVLIWWCFFAWWIKPLQAARRVDQVMLTAIWHQRPHDNRFVSDSS